MPALDERGRLQFVGRFCLLASSKALDLSLRVAGLTLAFISQCCFGESAVERAGEMRTLQAEGDVPIVV